MPDNHSSRTHEPNLRELTAQLDGLRELMDERDKRYQERSEAQLKAMQTAFAASEKAVDKAEAAQANYNVRSNEFRAQLDDQAKRLMPRAESEKEHETTREMIERLRVELRAVEERSRSDISNLRESRSAVRGAEKQGAAAWATALAILSLLIAVASILTSRSAMGH